MGRFGEHEPQRRAAVLTGQLDLEFPVQGQLGHRVAHDASVSAHLLPGQTLESDAFLREVQERAIVDPLVLGTGFGKGVTHHCHLGADLSRQDAFVGNGTGTQPHIFWPICRDGRRPERCL